MSDKNIHYADQMSAYIDNAVTAEVRQHIAAHLAQCPDCGRRHQELVRIRKAVNESPLLTPPESFYEAIHARTRSPKPQRWFSFNLPFKLLASACIALIAVSIGRHTMDRSEKAPVIEMIAMESVGDEKKEIPASPQLKRRASQKKSADFLPRQQPEEADRMDTVGKDSLLRQSNATVGEMGQAPSPASARVQSSPSAEMEPRKSDRRKSIMADLPMMAKAMESSSQGEWMGSNSGIETHGTFVVRSEAEMEDLWRRHAPNDPVPQVDFNAYIVVGVTLGRTDVSGQGIDILDTRMTSSAVIVYYRQIGSRDLHRSATTPFTPYRFKAIPKTTQPIQFQKTN